MRVQITGLVVMTFIVVMTGTINYTTAKVNEEG
jgi:hypothetical protein